MKSHRYSYQFIEQYRMYYNICLYQTSERLIRTISIIALISKSEKEKLEEQEGEEECAL